jgi:outer membrane cobalamin receptor
MHGFEPASAPPSGRGTQVVCVLLVCLDLALGCGAAAATPPFDQEPGPRTATLAGTVVRAPEGSSVAGAEVAVRESGVVVHTDREGRFTISGLPAGPRTLEVKAPGFVPQERALELKDGDHLAVEPFVLEPLPRFLSDVVVTPSQYSLYADAPAARASLSRDDVERMPHFAQDAFRAAQWLPGTSGEDISSQFGVRGGEAVETLVLVDGLEIQEPFHLKELFSLVSVVDAEVVDELQFTSGGFTVEHGNRMSAVMSMSTSSSGPTRTSLGVSTTHVGVLSEGQFGSGRGFWQVSARRTDLDKVIQWVDPENGLEPVFYDAFGKLSYQLGARATLSVNVLGARDRTHYVEQNGKVEELLDASSNSRYAWLGLRAAPASRVSLNTVLSVGSISRDRAGWIDYEMQSGTVDDRRSYSGFGLKQDWQLDLANRQLVKWGFELRSADASYDYRNRSVVRDALFLASGRRRSTNRVYDLAPKGESAALYLADRLRLPGRVVAELGVRWDRQTYCDDSQLSPRLNLVYSVRDRTIVRAAWGLFHQAQHINELQVSDGITTFYPAQRAEHRLLSLEHGFGRAYGLRVELYQKKIGDVWPRYENALNPIEVFPELEADRLLVAADQAEAKGIEVVVRRTGSRWSWWLCYAYARARDEIEGAWVPRSWDQPHTGSLSLNFRPNSNWNFNLSGVTHTGWPTTAVYGELLSGPDGSPTGVRPYLGPRNAERLGPYVRLDARASRDFRRGRHTWSAFVEVMNLLNRGNQARPDGLYFVLMPDGRLRAELDYESFLPLLPTVGVRWTF